MDFLFDKNTYRKYLVMQYLYDNKDKRVLKNELSSYVFGCSKTIMATIKALNDLPVDRLKDDGFKIEVDYKWVKGTFGEKFNIDKMKEFFLKESVGVKILTQLFEKDTLILYKFSIDNYYTETTIRNKIDELNTKLKIYRIHIKSGNAIKLVGTEENIQFFYVKFFRFLTKKNWKFLRNESNNIMDTLLSLEYQGKKIISPLQRRLLWDLNYLVRVIEKRSDLYRNSKNKPNASFKDAEIFKKIDYINRVQHFKIDKLSRCWMLYVVLSNVDLSIKIGLYKEYELFTTLIKKELTLIFKTEFTKIKQVCKKTNYILVQENIIEMKLLQLIVNDHFQMQFHRSHNLESTTKMKTRVIFMKVKELMQNYKEDIVLSSVNKEYFLALMVNHLSFNESSKYTVLVDTDYGNEWNELLLNKVLTTELQRYFKYFKEEDSPDIIITDTNLYSANESDIFLLKKKLDENVVQEIVSFLYHVLAKKV